MIKRLRRRILGGTAWCCEPACDLLEPAEDCLSGWEEASRWARWLYESGEAIDAVPLGGRGPPYVRSKAVGTSGALESADGGRSIVYKAKKDPKLLLQARRGLRPPFTRWAARRQRASGRVRRGGPSLRERVPEVSRGCGCTPVRLDCWSLESFSTAGANKTTRTRFYACDDGGLAGLSRTVRLDSSVRLPTHAHGLGAAKGLRPLPLPCWAGTPRALPVTARRRQRQKYLPPSAAPEGPTAARQRRQCQVCASNDAQIAGVSTVPVKICRAGRSWVRFTSCAALPAASYSRWLG